MADLVKDNLDTIYGRGLIFAETVAQELRELLADQLDESSIFLNSGAILEQARKLLSEFQPIFAEILTETELAAWVFGFDSVVKKTPQQVLDELARAPKFNPPPPPRFTFPGESGGNSPRIRFPIIEKAIESLQAADILTRDRFDMLANDMKRRAFTIAGQDSEDVLERIRDALVDDLIDGVSLDTFRQRVAQQVHASNIGPAHLELVYRNNVQTAFHDGHDELASEPLVADVFPYQEYLAIHDRRARDEHRALEFLGLDGTGVYRRDDPMWDLFLPPWDFNCRCGVRLMTVRQAAQKGVREAQQWLRTGSPPINPEHRLHAISFRPPAGFGTRRSVAA